MDSELRMRYRWGIIAVLAAPVLGLFGYSLVHPGIRGKDDRIFPAVVQAKPAAAAAASPWVMQDSGTDAGLRGIYSLDGKIAWASGTGGTVLRTVDGGEHWAKCAVPDGDKGGASLDFRGVQAWDELVAIVMSSGPGEKSRLYETHDGCRTWKLIFENPDKDGFWDAILKDSDGNLFILGDPVNGKFVLFSKIGKKAWSRDWNGQEIVALGNEGAFAASNSSLIEGGKGSFSFVTGGSKAEVIYEVHGIDDKSGIFSKWSRVALPLTTNESAGAFSIAIRRNFSQRPHDAYVAVGGDYKKPNISAGTAVFSDNWGDTWTASTKPPHGYRSSVSWSDELKAWVAAGTNGSDISRDDGKTWSPLDDGNWNALSLPFVVGPKGRIARLNVAAVK